jgi:hypothetical protein
LPIHGAVEALEVLHGQVLHPLHLNPPPTWAGSDGRVLLQLSLRLGPAVFDGITIWQIARPLHRMELFPHLLQLGRHHFGLLAAGPFLKKTDAVMHPHE